MLATLAHADSLVTFCAKFILPIAKGKIIESSSAAQVSAAYGKITAEVAFPSNYTHDEGCDHPAVRLSSIKLVRHRWCRAASALTRFLPDLLCTLYRPFPTTCS